MGKERETRKFLFVINDLTFLENLINGNSNTTKFKENFPKGELHISNWEVEEISLH